MKTCHFCHEYIDPLSPSTKQRITDGWVERNRQAGGSHGTTLPKYADEYAHGVCLEKVQRNITLGQTELFADG